MGFFFDAGHRNSYLCEASCLFLPKKRERERFFFDAGHPKFVPMRIIMPLLPQKKRRRERERGSSSMLDTRNSYLCEASCLFFPKKRERERERERGSSSMLDTR